jgi:hypothetical protein
VDRTGVGVGAGGTGGTFVSLNGGSGETSSFAGSGIATISATGGTGGNGASTTGGNATNNGGSGGSGSGGELDIDGGNGGNGESVGGVRIYTGLSVASAMAPTQTPGNNVGNAGVVPGGGAGGVANGANQSASNGAAGGAGRVLVTEYYEADRGPRGCRCMDPRPRDEAGWGRCRGARHHRVSVGDATLLHEPPRCAHRHLCVIERIPVGTIQAIATARRPAAVVGLDDVELATAVATSPQGSTGRRRQAKSRSQARSARSITPSMVPRERGQTRSPSVGRGLSLTGQPQRAVQPPSTMSVVPVTSAAAGEAR